VRRARALAVCAGLVCALACQTPSVDSAYRPTESALEVLAVLRLHVDDDTYRFPPARDFTGKNVYYASLVRLERLEEIYQEKYRSGYLLAPIVFGKGLALERMGEYGLAARHYERVSELDSELAPVARRNRELCERLAGASALAPAPDDERKTIEAIFNDRTALLETLAQEVADSHYRYVVQEETERADRERAEYFSGRATLDRDFEVLALQQYQRLVQSHPESKARNRHLLDLGDQYAALSRRYASRFAPTTLRFDPATFDEYVFGATRLYEAVSQQDGAIEKIEAARKLEAFLAFTLQVQDEKLPR
jgi:tetratricopeptide (TPR) repeat protein